MKVRIGTSLRHKGIAALFSWLDCLLDEQRRFHRKVPPLLCLTVPRHAPGSKIANITGMTAEEKEASEAAKEAAKVEASDADGSDGEGNGKRSGQFKSHMKKSEAASEFSRSKTIGQQRRSLPVYGIREDLMQVG